MPLALRKPFCGFAEINNENELQKRFERIRREIVTHCTVKGRVYQQASGLKLRPQGRVLSVQRIYGGACSSPSF